MLHPTVGRRYILIFPEGSVFFQEVADWYRSAAKRIPWMSVEGLSTWCPRRPEWQDPETILIFWGRFPIALPEQRRAGLVYRFSESVGAIEGLSPNQQKLLTGFMAIAQVPDLVLVGAPAVADFWRSSVRAVAVAPVGYEPDLVGAPNWASKKRFDLTFRGNVIGRRVSIIKHLKKALGDRLHLMEAFGLDRKHQLDKCRVDLYIGHSEELGFAGSRLWPLIGSSATLVTEPRDAWPAVPGRHYIEIEAANPERLDLLLETLERVLANPEELTRVSRTAHEELSAYTIDRCMEEFVVPATARLGGA